jgi:hypothetical protein
MDENKYTVETKKREYPYTVHCVVSAGCLATLRRSVWSSHNDNKPAAYSDADFTWVGKSSRVYIYISVSWILVE